MASRSLLTNVFVCARCQHHLARSAAITSFPSRSTTRSPLLFHAQSKRNFFSDYPRSNQPRNTGQDDADSAEWPLPQPVDTSQTAAVETRDADSVSSNAESVPWYLQELEEQEDINPFLERQRLPDLPQNPPPILEPLLKHASVDLGLDHLSLIDLRSLDPPPALGANLVMIFGSARSEKHLNVSADRLCRWLRSNYKLTPIADGLLGRNELKLKLRRKNRRAKTMSAAGASSPTEPDDGITAGWICVNVGTVDNGPDSIPEPQPQEPSNFIGFGSRFNGARIVVQIMTEDKRGELDLETLWQDALDTSVRRAEGARRARQKELDLAQESKETSMNHIDFPPTNSQGNPPIDSRSPAPRHAHGNSGGSHVRSFHTDARRQSADGISTSKLSENDLGVNHIAEDHTTSASETSTTEFDKITAVTDSEFTDAMLTSPSSEQRAMEQVNYLKTLKPSVAIWMLGQGQEDHSSTAFLRTFNNSIPAVPDGEHLFAQFELHCYALRIGHRRYTRHRLIQLLGDMQAAAISIPEETFLTAFETVLLAHSALWSGFKLQAGKTPNEKLRRFEVLGEGLRRILADAFEVLERMESYGHDARSTRVLTILHDAIANPVFEPPNTVSSALPSSSATSSVESLPPAKLAASQHARFRYLFRRALETLFKPPPGDNTFYAHILQSYIVATPPDWASFWDMWHHFARVMRPRTAEMYALMFNGVANTEHAAKCQETLMWQFPEMSREMPVIECKGEVASAVLECLIKAQVPRDAPPWEEMWTVAERGL